jgi:hypothetical protein
MADHSKMLAFIAKCDDAEKLRSLIKNAQKEGVQTIADAAFKRLVAVLPTERPGTVEYDFWRTVHAFEHALTEERGRTTRLGRTRQKVKRVGVVQTLRDWALDKQGTDGFEMLLERNMPDLTGEAIVLRHPEHFEPEVLAAAREKLTQAGVDLAKLPTPSA